MVWLKIENLGDVDFNYKLAVTVEGVEEGVSAMGDPIYLPDYLRFGAIFGETEAEVQAQIDERLAARSHAPNALGTWSDVCPNTFEEGEEPHYAALVVYMPEEVTNVANYRGVDIPKVKLGITVHAQQANAPLN